MSSMVQDKLANYEVSPPFGVWERIAEALDESAMMQRFPSRLYGIEVTPPASAWSKIAGSLEADRTGTIPERRKILRLFRYAAAAMVIGIFSWAGLRLFTDPSAKKTVAKQEIGSPEKDNPRAITNSGIPVPENISASPLVLPESGEEARNDAALEASKQTYARLEIPVKSRIKEIASDFYFSASGIAANIPDIISPEEADPGKISGRYITLMTPEGNIIRVSKKLTGLVCCVSGSDENNECRDQIKKWREKIVCSPTCHSTGSFMDLFGLVEALQDE